MLTTETPSNRMDSTNVERLARLHLARTGYSRLSAVECSFRDGTILLHGIVPSYYHKQMAQGHCAKFVTFTESSITLKSLRKDEN
jgi:hypothetical protein